MTVKTLVVAMTMTMTMTMTIDLKVLDGLLPVASEAVDYTRGKTIHKPGSVLFRI